MVVPETADTPAVLYIDLHLTHEVTSPQAYDVLRARGLQGAPPGPTLATMDHSTPTDTAQVFGGVPIAIESAARQIRQLEKNCAEFGVDLIGLQDQRRGIVHIIGPELGATQPGKTIVCGDSHTSTHGAFGALAFGIGTTEVGYVLATQCLLQRKAKTFAIDVVGQRLPGGVTAKDLVLAIIGQIGVNGGTGHVIEYRGAAIEALSMDERMTVCNMSIEAGARAGMIAPDDTTFDYLRGRPHAPQGAAWDAAVADWRTLQHRRRRHGSTSRSRSTPSRSTPMITFGTNPGMVTPISGSFPNGRAMRCLRSRWRTWACSRANSWPTSRCRSCSSAVARMRACPTSKRRRTSCAAARWPRACVRWSCPARSRSSARPRRSASPRCSSTPAPSGASPAARCASA